MPMMCVADHLAGAVPGRVVALRDVQVKGFVDFAGPRRLWTEVEPRLENAFFVRLFASTDESGDRSDGIEIASGRVETGSPTKAPAALDAEKGSAMSADPQ